MICPYCQNKKLKLLNGTCYCKECTSYFRIMGNQLDPIYIENREVYREYVAVEEQNILCKLCQELEEREHNRTRIQEEHKIGILGSKYKRRSVKKNNLCKDCTHRVNEKLKKDEQRYRPDYTKHLRGKRLQALIIFAVLCTSIAFLPHGVGVAIAVVWSISENKRSTKRLPTLLLTIASCLYKPLILLHLVVILALVLKKYKARHAIYLEHKVDLEKVEKEVLEKIKALKLSEARKQTEVARSFVHAPYNTHIKASEELQEIAKELAALRIRDNWYTKFDKLVEWMSV